ncbi:MAG: hypothetical protein H0T89_26765 [Deltaproteobacteria bacterium]|nr:hypothetical protein [Deltaproteobacteria bacterium]MDQ3298580.1 hypothetical protein [Myxococcota bacterium]
MAVLRAGSLLAVAAVTASCYSPEVRDCTVSCASAADCTGGQVCGGDQFCSAPEVAGTCLLPDGGVDGMQPPGDAALPVDARPSTTADAMPDAWPTVQLHVRIEGRGVVMLPTIGNCDGSSGQADCLYTVPQGTAVTLHAVPKNHWRFEEWTSQVCGNQPATCALVPDVPTFVQARFEEIDD